MKGGELTPLANEVSKRFDLRYNPLLGTSGEGATTMDLKVNGELRNLGEIDPRTPLLWVLRDELGLVGTKFGCGISQCGACTVLIDGQSVKSCSYPVSSVANGEVTTVEGLAGGDGELNAVQQAWVDLDVAQCGYCQSGQIMAAEALLRAKPNPGDDDIDQAMASNLCRCGTYIRIREAVKVAAATRRSAAQASDAAE